MTACYYFWDPRQQAKAFLRELSYCYSSKGSAIKRLEEAVRCCHDFRSTRVRNHKHSRERSIGMEPPIRELTVHLSGLVLRTAGASSGRGAGTRRCTGPTG